MSRIMFDKFEMHSAYKSIDIDSKSRRAWKTRKKKT